MGRFETASIISLALLLGFVACEKNQTPPQPLTTCADGTWCPVPNESGLWFVHNPNFKDPNCGGSNCPEFVILRMTNARYQEFQSACTATPTAGAVDWLNKHANVFSNWIKKVSACPPAVASSSGAPYSYVTVLHWPNSTAAPAVYPETSP
ncbi:MAG TPA: hypothetical protein VKQ11_18830 [Candidatus Sulfotelmatobacter sp.]|nr:hypothetical protein [Candidatus Sulfotelmatobacter sp.]